MENVIWIYCMKISIFNKICEELKKTKQMTKKLNFKRNNKIKMGYRSKQIILKRQNTNEWGTFK